MNLQKKKSLSKKILYVSTLCTLLASHLLENLALFILLCGRWMCGSKLQLTCRLHWYVGRFVAERSSYFCLARKLIGPLWSSHIFTQWGWLILFSPDHFPGQHKNGESPPNYHFLRTCRVGRTYFLSAPFIAAESQYHEESRLIYGPFESTFLDQGFPVEHELDACNPPLTGILLCHL